MDSAEFLDVAKFLVELDNPSPAECRTAISRAYYGVFNVIKDLLIELRVPLEKQKDSHKEVLDIVVQSGDATLKQVCDSLGHIKTKRKDADYDMKVRDVETRAVASRELCLARDLIRKIQKVRTDGPTWIAASSNIVDHARNVLKKHVPADTAPC
jgi:uncharacterized protein (UPF0332 family)